jgi:ABC-type multidrug transport system ATPase subunit
MLHFPEQFDVQSAELTVRETIRFSAILRLDRSNPVFTVEDGLNKHVEKMIDMLELTNEADMLVGSAEEGGLTFEQKKRLSIAVELAASPSIVFLDEPTSGLDARAALLVMNALRKIASTGRTIVCTIHQVSLFYQPIEKLFHSWILTSTK